MMSQVLPASFFALLNLYLHKLSFSSSQIGILNSYRYLVVFLFAAPLALFVPGYLAKKLLAWSGVVLSLSGAFILYATAHTQTVLMTAGMWFMGVALLVQQSSIIPSILEHETEASSAKALSWHFAMLSAATLVVGLVSLVLSSLPGALDPVEYVLWGSVAVSCLGAPYLFLGAQSAWSQQSNQVPNPSKEIWLKIARLLVPQFLISAGAGLSIPYLNLFFHEKWDLGHQGFMLITAFSTMAVIVASLWAHRLAVIKGERALCAGSQYLSVACLIGLGFCGGPIGLPIALVLFFMRQPLMNMGSPILSKFMMNYVGEPHRRLLGALSQMSWGLGWFVSSVGYGLMRSNGFTWSDIFWATGACYLVAGVWYAELMKEPKPQIA